MKDITKVKFGDLTALYTIVSDICSDYSRMTDNYSLATGNKLFEDIPSDIAKMIEDRQKFFNIRNKIKEEIKNRILKDYDEQT